MALEARSGDLERRCEPADDLVGASAVISRLLDVHVRFLIVGGWAVMFHGVRERHVRDLDLLVEFSPENWPKVESVLQYLGIPVKKTFEELAQGSRPLRIKHDPVDILTSIGSAFSESKSSVVSKSTEKFAVASPRHGISFGEAWADGIETRFDERGLQVRVLSKAHVILSKEQSNRPQDADDIQKLLEVREMDGHIGRGGKNDVEST